MPTVGMNVTGNKILRAAEVLLWLAGLLLASVLLNHWAQARSAQAAAMNFGSIGSSARASPQSAAAQGSVATAAPSPGPDDSSGRAEASIIGRLEIPAIKLSVPVVNDYDTAALLRGVGRIGGTALPGGLGNFVVAGHRDTFFRPLRHIERGMEMRVVTAEGAYRYQVDRTEIVTPDQVDVLDIGSRPEMTLITCFPFDYIGAAPRRFVVHAHLLSLAPSAN